MLVAQSCLTLCDTMDCSPPGSSVHGILQARIKDWVAILFSRGCSWPKDWTWVSCIADSFFTIWLDGKEPTVQYWLNRKALFDHFCCSHAKLCLTQWLAACQPPLATPLTTLTMILSPIWILDVLLPALVFSLWHLRLLNFFTSQHCEGRHLCLFCSLL